MKKRKKKSRHLLRWFSVIAILTVIALVAWSYKSLSDEEMQRGRALVRYNAFYTVDVDDEPVIFFSHADGDSLLVGASADSLERMESKLMPAVWVNKYSLFPSCFGSLILHADSIDRDSLATLADTHVDDLVLSTIESIKARNTMLDEYIEDMEYYLSVHGVQDEGFDYINECNNRMTQRKALTEKTLKRLLMVDSVMRMQHSRVTVKSHVAYNACYYDSAGNFREEPCEVLMRTKNEETGQYYWLLQTESHKTPEGVKARNRHRVLPAMDNIGDMTADQWGVGNGKGDSVTLNVDRHEYSGFLHQGKKQGKGIIVDAHDRMIEGVWEHDTLVSGRRKDHGSTYIGTFNRKGIAQGHGIQDNIDGSYYEGHWQGDQRNVFGFSLSPSAGMKVGEWKDDKYLGERVVYTNDRIFGIDISKYQHEQKKLVTTKAKVKNKRGKYVWKERQVTVNKIYAINWSDLRITSLGTRGKKVVSGSNFPVSFVYIKATEGTSITNKYFVSDYTAARRNGYKVGAYHFFSTRTNAADQAYFFLANSRFNKGDFPPVLDVEPTADLVRQIGGKEELIRRITTWLKIVEKRVGVKPVLYVSQNFIKKYLSDDKEIKKNYKIWIARYGEYKPDFKLVYWQMCDNGRVKGIVGDVDINVFNGYGSQFEEFKLNNCVTK